ncbi:MAG TPA: hypothetical protein VGX76_01540, partial [Pirellulales bacterium]|nr:hypothetical protein [Pirellulales bacterium]
SIQELARFWDTHDLIDFDDELEEVTERVFDREQAITLRLPTTGNRLLRDGEALATAEEELNVKDRQMADAETQRQRLTGALASAQNELKRLRRELDETRRRGP